MDFRYLVVAIHGKVCLYWKGVVFFSNSLDDVFITRFNCDELARKKSG